METKTASCSGRGCPISSICKRFLQFTRNEREQTIEPAFIEQLDRCINLIVI